jgi:N-acetylmuramoyl-L-alanine amidase
VRACGPLRATLGLLGAAALAGALLAPGATRGQPGVEPQSAPVALLDGVPYVGAGDVARLLGATFYWRGDVRKLVLRAGDHSIKLTADNPYVLVDERAYLLPGRVRMVRGELQVPVALFALAWPESLHPHLRYDAHARRLTRVPDVSAAVSPQIAYAPGLTRLVLPTQSPGAAHVAWRGRSRFRLRFADALMASVPESLPAASLVRSLRLLPATAGSALELRVSPAAAAYRLSPDSAAGRLVLEVAVTAGEDPAWQRFAPEMPPGPRPLRVIVLDPGHGGDDEGVVVGELKEKDLALSLARELRTELARRFRARVLLTRDGDASPTLDERAEIANRARADVVLSLHFDGFPRPEARGVTAFVPPASYGADAGSGRPRGGTPLVLVPWRDAATRFAVPSRELAEDLLAACDLRGLGPTRLYEHLPYSLVGVNAPGVLLECGMLTSPEERARLAAPAGLRELARTIAQGLESYQRAGTPL